MHINVPGGHRSAYIQWWAVALTVLVSVIHIHAQGTVNFNQPWLSKGIAYSPLHYFNSFSFRMVPYPPQPHDNMAHVGAGLSEHPNNGTPHLEFENTLGIIQYAVINPTNNSIFGLTSVDLADPMAPSLTPMDITFNGFRADDSMVSQTFTVGGGGSSSFQTYQFNSDFAWGLTRLEIPSGAWAMDNLVWVPEPASVSLFLLGLLALVMGRAWRR